MDQWHVVAEGRLGGELWLKLKKGFEYRTVPYYDEFTEQSVFKAVARGHTDPRAYCMGCGGDEGALHENWCHAVKEAHRKKTAHHNVKAAGQREWRFQSCKTGNWHSAFFEHGEYAMCPGCKMNVKEPERPLEPPSVGEQIRQALSEWAGREPEPAPPVNIDDALARRAVNHRAFGNEYHWSWITCIGGVWRDAEYGFKEATCPDCKGTVVAPERPRAKKPVDPPPPAHPTGVNWVGAEAKSWWFWCARNGLTTTNSAGINECKCMGCGKMVQAPGVTFRAAVHPESGYIQGNSCMAGQPEDRWLPGKEPPPVETARKLMERAQPSAVSQAKAFHLRPPRREIVVLVDDQSEPP